MKKQAAPPKAPPKTPIQIPSQAELLAEFGTPKLTVEQIATLAARQVAKEAEIAQAEAHLKMLKEDLAKIANGLLPTAFDEAGIKEIVLPNGNKVVVNDILTANIIEENLAKAFAWLRANKAGAIIKNKFEVSLGKGQDKIAKALTAACKKLKIPVTRKESVNWQTLQAFVRERMQAGKALPPEINVTKVPTAKVIPPKE